MAKEAIERDESKSYMGEYRNFKAELKRVGVTQAQIAKYFSMSANNFNAKVNGKVPFSVPEIVEIREQFMPDATLDYLLEYWPIEPQPEVA